MRLSAVFALVAGMVGIGPANAANPVVVLETTYGTIKIELFEDHAPNTVKNFLGYVDDKYYDGLLFHGAIKGFQIQGGGFEPGMHPRKSKEPIKNEPKLSNKRRTIGMAQKPGKPDSATSEFYFNLADNVHLDPNPAEKKPGYTVFGQVIEGMDVVDKIAAVRTAATKNVKDVPIEDIVIKSARRMPK
jgi:cyclophilin family peptidyl-prolyl cis-trans isomerase